MSREKIYKSMVYLTTSNDVKDYSFNFDFINYEYVKARIGDTELSYGKDYTVSQSKRLTLTANPPDGSQLIVYRQTPTDRQLTWEDASILRAADLNLFNIQLLHITEEMHDKLLDDGLSRDKRTNQWNAKGARITNVADPVDPQDVVTKAFFSDTQQGYLSQSQKKVDEATAQASTAEYSAKRAGQYADEAKRSADSALEQANEATVQATLATSQAQQTTFAKEAVSADKAIVINNKNEVQRLHDNVVRLDSIVTAKKETVNSKTDLVTHTAEDVDRKYQEIKGIGEQMSTEYADVKNMSTNINANISVAINAKDTATTAAQTATDKLTAVEAVETRVRENANQNITAVTNAHTTAMSDIQAGVEQAKGYVSQSLSNATAAERSSNTAQTQANTATVMASKATSEADLAKQYAEQAKQVAGGDFVTRTEAETKYLKKTDKIDAYTKSETDDKFQPKGDYVTTRNVRIGYGSHLVVWENVIFDAPFRVVPVDKNQARIDVDNAIYGIKFGQPLLDYSKTDEVEDFINQKVTGLASVEYVDGRVANIVNSAPETLDTLQELAQALGNDPNFAATVSKQIGTKADKATMENALAGKADKSELIEVAKSVARYELEKSKFLTAESIFNGFDIVLPNGARIGVE